jgi:hypothetical protein
MLSTLRRPVNKKNGAGRRVGARTHPFRKGRGKGWGTLSYTELGQMS